jgi:hypothetical protein
MLAEKELRSNAHGLTIRKRQSLAAILSAEFNNQLK